MLAAVLTATIFPINITEFRSKLYMKNKYYWLLVLICFIACNKTNKTNLIYSNSPDIEQVVMDSINLSGAKIINSERILLYNDYIVNVNSNCKDSILQFWNLNSHKYAGSTGALGRGPNDFSFFNQLCCHFHNNKLHVFEQYCYSDYDVAFKDNRVIIKRLNKIGSEFVLSNAFLSYGNNISVLKTNNDNFCEFYLATPNENKHQEWLTYPKLPDTKGIPSEFLSTAFHSHVVFGPDSLFAALYSYYPMLSIQSIQNQQRKFFVLDDWTGQYVSYFKEEGKLQTDKMCYHEACSNNQIICGLYFGLNSSDIPNVDINTFRPEIHVWDWDGKLIKKLKVNRFVNHITMDEKNRLYLYSPLEDNTIYTIQL